MSTGIHHGRHIADQECCNLRIRGRYPAILRILEDVLHFFKGGSDCRIRKILCSLIAMFDKISVLAHHLIIVSLVEPESYMPDILSADHERCHIPLIPDLLTEFHKFIVCLRLREPVLIKILLIINNSLCILTAQRSRIRLSVKCNCRFK